MIRRHAVDRAAQNEEVNSLERIPIQKTKRENKPSVHLSKTILDFS